MLQISVNAPTIVTTGTRLLTRDAGRHMVRQKRLMKVLNALRFVKDMKRHERRRKLYNVYNGRRPTALTIRCLYPTRDNLYAALLQRGMLHRIIYSLILMGTRLYAVLAVPMNLHETISMPLRHIMIDISLRRCTRLQRYYGSFRQIVIRNNLSTTVARRAMLRTTLYYKTNLRIVRVNRSGTINFRLTNKILRSNTTIGEQSLLTSTLNNDMRTYRLPLATGTTRIITTIIINKDTPRIKAKGLLGRLLTNVTMKDRATIRVKRRGVRVFTPSASIIYAIHGNGQHSLLTKGKASRDSRALSGNSFVALLYPTNILLRARTSNRYVFAERHEGRGQRQRTKALFKDGVGVSRFLLLVRLSVAVRRDGTIRDVHENRRILVPSFGTEIISKGNSILVTRLSLLRLKEEDAVAAMNGTISTRVVINEALARITTVNLRPLTMTIFFPSKLISMVPSGTTLVTTILLINGFHMLIRDAIKITRDVEMFTLSVEPLVTLYRVLFGILRDTMRVTLGVNNFRRTKVVSRAFMVRRANIVGTTSRLYRLRRNLATGQFITREPSRGDEVIFIALMDKVRTIGRSDFPLQLVVKRGTLSTTGTDLVGVPYTVKFRVILYSRVRAVLITRIMRYVLVLMVTNASNVSIILLRNSSVPGRFLVNICTRDAAHGKTRLVAINALRRSTLTIRRRPVILRLRLTRASFLPNRLCRVTYVIRRLSFRFVRDQILYAPRIKVLRHVTRRYETTIRYSFFKRRFRLATSRNRANHTLALRLRYGFRHKVDGVVPNGRHFSKCVFRVRNKSNMRPRTTRSTKRTRRILVFTPTKKDPLRRLRDGFIRTQLRVKDRVRYIYKRTILNMARVEPIRPGDRTTFRALRLSISKLTLRKFQRLRMFCVTYRQVRPLQSLTQLCFFATVPQVLGVHMLKGIMTLRLSIYQGVGIVPTTTVMVHLFGTKSNANMILYMNGFPSAIRLRHREEKTYPVFFTKDMDARAYVDVRRIFLRGNKIFCFYGVGYDRDVSSFAFCGFVVFLRPPQEGH